MPASPANGADRIQLLLDHLGYTSETGWIAATDFGGLATHRFAMQQAEREMSVIGAVCLKRWVGPSQTIAAPIVYVARVADEDAAQEVHRKVWSQGLAPFLLVATPDHVVLCPGFSYVRQDWRNLVQWFTWRAVKNLRHTQAGPTDGLSDLCAIRLRTSLFWRDHAIDVAGRIDLRLLTSLDALSDVLIRGVGVSRALSSVAANGLIGRFLYAYFLADRGIIDQQWVTARGHVAIDLAAQNVDWANGLSRPRVKPGVLPHVN